MKHTFIMSLALGLSVAASLVASQAVADDTTKLEGTWTLVSGEKDGEPLSEQVIKNSLMTIVGDTHTVQVGDMILKGTHQLRATKTPKQIDAIDTEGPTIGHNFGIYELTATGDFRVCFAPTGKERPTEFVTQPGSGHFCHVWRRTKSE